MAGRGGREHSRAAEGLAAALTLFCFHVRLRLALWASCLPMPGFFPRYPYDICRQPHNLADSLARHLVSAAACSREAPHACCDVYNVGLGCLAPAAVHQTPACPARCRRTNDCFSPESCSS
jgi:hypothetical protein